METNSLTPKKPGRPRKTHTRQSQLNQITVHLPPDLVSALDDEIGMSGLHSRSELIREACHRYLQQRKQELPEPLSLTRQMRGFSKDERRKAMTAAAETLAEYYRSDPEIRDWQALDREDFYDIGD